MNDRRYPIGPFVYTGPHDAASRAALIARIASLPARLRHAAGQLAPGAMDTPYREGGWTPRQVIHHLADSHMHSLLRFKYALAVDGAPILAYPEHLWAELPDYAGPVELALDLIAAAHAKWVHLLGSMGDGDFARTFLHPDNGSVTLDRALEIYAWHGDHHLAHVELMR